MVWRGSEEQGGYLHPLQVKWEEGCKKESPVKRVLLEQNEENVQGSIKRFC